MANFRTNKNNILLINTVNPGQPFFGIFNGAGKLLHSGSFIDKQEELVGKLKAYLVEHKIDTSDLKKIFVLKGRGSFTASRAGVVLAKAIGFLENYCTGRNADAGNLYCIFLFFSLNPFFFWFVESRNTH